MDDPRLKATPDPWIVWSSEGQKKNGQYRHSVCHHVGELDSKDHKCVAEAYGDTEEEAETNAGMIAAAPDLYGALNFILAFYEPGQTYLDTNAWKQAEAGARRAMAKARGET